MSARRREVYFPIAGAKAEIDEFDSRTCPSCRRRFRPIIMPTRTCSERCAALELANRQREARWRAMAWLAHVHRQLAKRR